MMIEDYSFLYMEELPSDGRWDDKIPKYDYFISAFTKADRVRTVFDLCPAKQKHWLVLSEYDFSASELPTGTQSEKVHVFQQQQEDALIEIRDWWRGLNINSTTSLCIDATGVLRPVLLFLMRLFDESEIKKYDVLYAEPNWYIKQENTKFSDGFTEVKTIPGFGGIHDLKLRDLLIIGAGYEDKLITEVAESKKASFEKVLIYGFPPLQADMFQESILRVYNSEQAIGYEYNASRAYFAPANDPFLTANTLRQIIKDKTHDNSNYNVYLSPLSTKPQVLGFGLFYITEKRYNTPCSIIFPFAKKYTSESAKGTGRIWRYTIEIPDDDDGAVDGKS